MDNVELDELELNGNYRVKAHSRKSSAWYMKIIWKLQHHFTDIQINWLMG